MPSIKEVEQRFIAEIATPREVWGVAVHADGGTYRFNPQGPDSPDDIVGRGLFPTRRIAYEKAAQHLARWSESIEYEGHWDCNEDGAPENATGTTAVTIRVRPVTLTTTREVA